MPLELTITKSVHAAAAVPSERVLQTAAMFGLGIDETRELSIVPACVVPIAFPSIIFITGPSGGGKSTILALLACELQSRGVRVLRSPLACNAHSKRVDDFEVDDLDDDRPIIERIGDTFEQATAILSRVGLSDAFVMLRRASELSDGQKARFELARLMEAAEHGAGAGVGGREPIAILIDEFAATLDRITAKAIARNLRKWMWRCAETSTEICLVIATTHDDLLEPLTPDVLVWKGLGEDIEVVRRSAITPDSNGEVNSRRLRRSNPKL